jgi:hypothetical protein
MPVTAAAREVLQSHFGAATLEADPEKYLRRLSRALIETMALAAGMKLESERASPCRRDWSDATPHGVISGACPRDPACSG